MAVSTRLHGNLTRLRWWWRKGTSPLRLLPNFVLLGGMKCGTTTMYQTLCQHPQVLPALVKEVHFFDGNHQQGLGWYRAHFPLAPAVRLREFLRRRRLVTGEATPFYIFHPHVPRRLHALAPHARLIVMLRDPVTRAFSHYRYNVKNQEETLSFVEALAREDDRLAGERELMLRNENYVSENFRRYSYAARGIYVDQLAAWQKLFAPEQFLIVKSEDYFADPGATLARVFTFLSLGPHIPAAVRLPNIMQRTSVPAAAAARLRKFFAPHNERLYELLDRDMGWDQSVDKVAAYPVRLAA